MNAIYSNKIAVVGPKNQVLPFLAIGAEVFIAEDIRQARDGVLKFAENNCPVIFVSDDYMEGIMDIIKKFASQSLPSITSIPGDSGTTSFARKMLNSQVKKAVGIDLQRFDQK